MVQAAGSHSGAGIPAPAVGLTAIGGIFGRPWLVLASAIGVAACPPGGDTLWVVGLDGTIRSGCPTDIAPSDTLAARRTGELAAAFLQRAGETCLLVGKADAAVDLFSRARTAGGPEDTLLARLAEALWSAGRPERALAATWAHPRADSLPVLLDMRARLLQDAGLHEEAVATTRKARNLSSSRSGQPRQDQTGWTRPWVAVGVGARIESWNPEPAPAVVIQRRNWMEGWAPVDPVVPPSEDSVRLTGRLWPMSFQSGASLRGPRTRWDAVVGVRSAGDGFVDGARWGFDGMLRARRGVQRSAEANASVRTSFAGDTLISLDLRAATRARARWMRLTWTAEPSVAFMLQKRKMRTSIPSK